MHSISLKVWILSGVVGLFAVSAHGAEYFVSRQGDDANAGTSRAEAFRTIQHGVDALEPGDTLTIAPGEYFESVRREGIGSDEARTVIRAEIPGTVLLRGDRSAPEFEPVEGRDYVYVADFDSEAEVHAVNELDTLAMLEPMPNAIEPEFLTGKFYHDIEAGKLYISSSDWREPSEHRYSVSVTPTHGFYLADATRVTIDGLAATGFKASHQQPRHDYTLYSTWGIYIAGGKDCVIRNCRAYLNGQGIGINSRRGGEGEYGDNVIEKCVAWGNVSHFGVGDRGGITLVEPASDVVRDSRAFLNGHYGINIRGGGPNAADENKSRLISNIAWGNGSADVKIKTGYDNPHTTERSVAFYPSNDYDPVYSLFKRLHGDLGVDSIALEAEEDLDVNAEFADPVNHDYRLQATSRFRGAGPDGADRGPYPYEPNIFYLATDGSDEADGLSLAQAWRTFSHAAATLKPGDTLYLEPGVYETAGSITLEGTADEPISIRGRGRGAVLLRDAVRLEDSRHVAFKRLQFVEGVDAAGSEDVHFQNCKFHGRDTALAAPNSAGLEVRHCEFIGFEAGAIDLTGSERAHLAGILYDNQHGPALLVDDVQAMRYSDYNSYREGSPAWRVGDELRSFQAVKERHEPQSSTISTPCTAEHDGAEINGKCVHRAARGPFGRPVGTYRNEPRDPELRLVHAPGVHSVSATTANLHWRTSLPAVCEIAWGPTPETERADTFAVDRFGSFSFTGLEPGQTYYFRVKSLRLPRDVAEKLDAAVTQPEGQLVSFTTLSQDESPKTYYVAPDGNDAGDGLSRDRAWRTLSHAAAQVNVGDTVRIAGGTYAERVRILSTGTPEAPITFESIPGEKVVLSGAGKKLGQIFVATGKKHLRFDGLYFTDTSRDPLQGWRLQLCGEFNLYRCEDVQITRCFSDTPSGYSARFISAWEVRDLLVRNCVTMNKMSGSMMLWPAPNFRMEHSVVARPLTGSMVFRNDSGQPTTLQHNIFTDQLRKKAAGNIPYFYGSTRDMRQENNVYFLRDFFSPEERHLFADQTMDDLGDVIIDPLFTDPHLAGDENHEDDHIDQMMHPHRELDFDDFFATNPAVNERGIGLQKDRFAEFHFAQDPDE